MRIIQRVQLSRLCNKTMDTYLTTALSTYGKIQPDIYPLMNSLCLSADSSCWRIAVMLFYLQDEMADGINQK